MCDSTISAVGLEPDLRARKADNGGVYAGEMRGEGEVEWRCEREGGVGLHVNRSCRREAETGEETGDGDRWVMEVAGAEEWQLNHGDCLFRRRVGLTLPRKTPRDP